jgi:acetyltransferase-like isoleucine patch superfamily enzyme
MNRLLYYLYFKLAMFSRVLRSRNFYMILLKKSHEYNGVVFKGVPRFIHPSAYLDGSYNLSIGENIVISTGVVILTHDYSYTAGLISINEKPITDIAIHDKVEIGNNCFIGANATILPGTHIGDSCIIAAGAVVKGVFEKNSIIAGNPAIVKFDTREWIKNKKNKKDIILHQDKV